MCNTQLPLIITSKLSENYFSFKELFQGTQLEELLYLVHRLRQEKTILGHKTNKFALKTEKTDIDL